MSEPSVIADPFKPVARGYTIRQSKQGFWRIWYDNMPDELMPHGFKTLREAKRFAWTIRGVLPPVWVNDAVNVDYRSNAVHRALRAIEARHTNYEIHIVTPTHYYIRRQKFSAEFPIAYRVRKGMVTARNDSEFLE